MQSVAKWTLLAAGIAAAGLTHFEATHPIKHVAWFLLGVAWALCCVLAAVVFRRTPDRNKWTPEARARYDDDMSI